MSESGDEVITKFGPLLSQFPWLSFFSNEAILDDNFRDWVAQCGHDPENLRYDLYQLERLLSDLSSLLDRCLAYRREYMELQATAVRQALEYQYYRTQYKISQELEDAPWIREGRQLDEASQAEVAAVFEGIAGENILARGLAANAQASQRLNAQAAAGEQTRRAIVQRKWELFANHQGELEKRHSTPGHPLNFAERAHRVLTLMKEDFTEAALKAFVVSISVQKIFSLDVGTRWATSSEPLDDLLVWTRKILRELDTRTHEEIEFFAFGILPRPREGEPAGFGAYYQIPKLTPDHEGSLQGIRNKTITDVRIRAIGAQIVFDMEKLRNPSALSTIVTIKIPHRGHLDLLATMNPPDMTGFYGGSMVRNLSPFVEGPDPFVTNWEAGIFHYIDADSMSWRERDGQTAHERRAFTRLHQVRIVFKLVGTRKL